MTLLNHLSMWPADDFVACGLPRGCAAAVFIRDSPEGFRFSAVGFHAASLISSGEVAAYLASEHWVWGLRPVEGIPTSVPWRLADFDTNPVGGVEAAVEGGDGQ